MQQPGEAQKKQAAFLREYSQQLSTAIRYTEALKMAERAIGLDASSPEGWYIKGTCLAMMARYQEALNDFEHALRLNGHYAAAWDGKAWVLGILGKRAEALSAVNKALEIDPDYFEALKRKKRIEKM